MKGGEAMAKKKGKGRGWHGDSAGHSKAAKMSWRKPKTHIAKMRKANPGKRVSDLKW